jgi:hypothetical protein
MERESSLRNAVLNKNRMMDNVHKHNICITYTGTQTDLLGMGFHINITDMEITHVG